MTLTLLLDLDDTLLNSNMDVFIPAYFKKLAGYLASHVDPQKLIKELLAGTNLMFKNERPDLTLDEVFSNYFYPALEVDRAELHAEIEHFYDDVFPSLKGLTAPRPEAVALVEWALKQGWQVVVATNPLFPRKAIDHRLRWANLPPEKYPFALVTSYETCHFAKEIPAYYSEILGNLGWPDGPVIMVGDDTRRDIDSALRAGLPIYWIRPKENHFSEYADFPQGSVKDFWKWIEKVDFDSIQPNFKNPEALTHLLQSTPAVLDTLIRKLKPAEWTKRPQKDEWALNEILCHLRDVETEVNFPRVQATLVEENVLITGQNTDPWAVERKYFQQDGAAAFRDFVTARMRLVEMLKSISTDGWQRRARHTIFGPTNLQELVSFMAEHDRLHIRQAQAVAQKQS